MKIKASEAVPGQWYLDETCGRVLCCKPGDFYSSDFGFYHLIKTNAVRREITHLPDCTGWDWQPPTPEKRYRAFASAEEFKPHRDRWILTPGQETIRRIDFYNDQWVNGMSYDSLFRNRTFEDGSPCGVEVSE